MPLHDDRHPWPFALPPRLLVGPPCHPFRQPRLPMHPVWPASAAWSPSPSAPQPSSPVKMLEMAVSIGLPCLQKLARQRLRQGFSRGRTPRWPDSSGIRSEPCCCSPSCALPRLAQHLPSPAPGSRQLCKKRLPRPVFWSRWDGLDLGTKCAWESRLGPPARERTYKSVTRRNRTSRCCSQGGPARSYAQDRWDTATRE